MSCWYTNYCYVKSTYDKLISKDASTVMNMLAHMTGQSELRRHINMYMGAYENIQKRACDISVAYRQFVDAAFELILGKTCRELIPELSYAAYVVLRQRGLVDTLEDMLGEKIDSVEKLCRALVACRNVKYVNKLCLELDIASRINQLVSSDNDYVFHIFCNSTLFERNAQLVSWLINQATVVMDQTGDIDAFFLYARQIFAACRGDAFLFYSCVQNVSKVVALPKSVAPSVPFLTHLATVAGKEPVAFYLNFAAKCSKKKQVFVLDFAADYVPLYVGGSYKLSKRRCGARSIVVPDINDFVIRNRTAANQGCLQPPTPGTETTDTIAEFSTSIRDTANVVWIFRNFRVENRTHFNLYGVRLFLLSCDRVYEINLVSGLVRCLYVLDAACVFCQFFPHNKIIVYDQTIHKYLRKSIRDLTCHVQHVKQNMFYPKEFYPYLREFLGTCSGFFELHPRYLFFLNDAHFFGRIGGKRYFVSKEFVVFLV